MKRLVTLFGLFLLASCASVPPPAQKIEPSRERFEYERFEYMTASWYGPKFHGRPTASGERYDMYDLTAAHKTLKFGTKLRVTNPDNNKSVVVKVNDRGPFIPGRDLDLSYGAAKKIGLIKKGVGRVKIEYQGRDMLYSKRIPFVPPEGSGLLTIQVGSFTEPARAIRLKQGLEYKYKDVYITSAFLKGAKYHRVRVGKFNKYSKAYSVAEKLADEGYTTLIMTGD